MKNNVKYGKLTEIVRNCCYSTKWENAASAAAFLEILI